MTRRTRKTRNVPPKLKVGEGTTILAPSGDTDGGAGVKVEGDTLVIALDAAGIIDAARVAALAELRELIMTGRDPDGKPRPALGRRAAAEERVSPHRLFKTGHTADLLRSTAIRGRGRRASATIYPPTDRNVVLAREAERGHLYVTTGTRVTAAIDEALAEACGLVVSGHAVEPETDGEVAASEAAGDGAPRRAPDAGRSERARRGWETRRRRDAEIRRRTGGES